MGSDRGNTTVAAPVPSWRATAGSPDLVLVWLFPRPTEATVVLNANGDDERVIGRDEGCAIRLEGNDVSRRHAVLRRPAGASPGRPTAQIVDLQSRNGVHVNGRQITAATLGAGDVVRIGGWIGVVTGTPGACTQIAPGLFGGEALRAAVAPLQRAAPSDLPIVLEGETGTGKEVVARSIHAWSGRSGSLVAVNCAALPEGLAEGELFGYRRGAFTGADRASAGFFRNAHGGTLLLDEVSDLTLPLQAKLLRVLEERAVQPLGESHPIAIDVRVVVAGQQSLMEAVRQGRFRPDLLARLDGVTVRLPPLRDRREDVPPLFSHFLNEFGAGWAPAIEGEVIERLLVHDWPFNVREIVLLVRRLIVLHGSATILRAAHLPERIGDLAKRVPLPEGAAPGDAATVTSAASAAPDAPAESVELPALVAALRTTGGNVARAAAMLGITRQRAYRLMDGKAVDLETLRHKEEGMP